MEANMNRYVMMLTAVALSMAASSAYGDEIQCRITGELMDASVPVDAFSGGIIGSYEPASGLPTGKRQHRPATILKKLDALSPALFQAAVTNRTLAAVECSFYRNAPRKTKQLYYRITLTQPRIVDLSVSGAGPTDTVARETVQFVYHKITLEDVLTGTVAEDFWEIPES
ncbi:type VI secretion system tube protein TssD [Thiocapsa sp.]|uniref:type VI secretion system tube protein TssD n=1 Tax=Thiocapsa sp. TaxID=2024551 RepID=UPI002C5412FB|nr:type VI secretion system tube protein TssD [Thiocapsa sp.]HSO84328.1 type VI secretion system tube protein TssD [Thiocapsa sp.]